MTDDDNRDNDAIQTLMAVTGLESATEAGDLLASHNNKLQMAVQSWLDAQMAAETGTSDSSLRHRRPPAETTPGPITENNHRLNAPKEPWWYQLIRTLMWPVASTMGWLYQLASYTYIGGLLLGSEELSSEAAHAKFILNFESLYGRSHPEFTQCTYSQALAAAKRDLKFLLIYLHSPQHQDTSFFCENVLCNADFLDFIRKHNVLVWVSSIATSEAYRVSNVLQISGYPALALACMKGSQMAVVGRVTGIVDVKNVISLLDSAIQTHGIQIEAARMDRQEQNASRSIRQEQDSAYQASLRRDREKAKLQKHAEEERLAKERQLEDQAAKKQSLLESQSKYRQKQRDTLPAEPTSGSIANIVYRLPDGSRLKRKFLSTENVQMLYHFADTLDSVPLNIKFVLVSSFPRKVFDQRDISLEEADLSPNGIVIVEEVLEQ